MWPSWPAPLLNRIENPDQRQRPPVLLEAGYEMVLRNSTAAPARLNV
jgi:hypothetical protein